MISTIKFLCVILLSVSIFSCSGPGNITLELTQTSDLARIDFDHAYTMVWCGDVKLDVDKVGEFTGSVTKTNLTGENGWIMQYDVIIPHKQPIADFFSFRTNHIVTDDGADHGVVFVTSSDYKFLIGATVEMDGDITKISWDSGNFPAGSPLAP